jgi:hypothetical protein
MSPCFTREPWGKWVIWWDMSVYCYCPNCAHWQKRLSNKLQEILELFPGLNIGLNLFGIGLVTHCFSNEFVFATFTLQLPTSSLSVIIHFEWLLAKYHRLWVYKSRYAGVPLTSDQSARLHTIMLLKYDLCKVMWQMAKFGHQHHHQDYN